VRDAATGDWHLAKPGETIPGAHWFPEAGRGHPDPAIARWFDDGIARLHRGHPGQPLIVFCLADCWMSWNAALRLHRAGYAHVLWFAEGADGWRDIGRPLIPVTPYKASR
jgi:PQQ-dependent catabolism-associated CXXCW motif protein